MKPTPQTNHEQMAIWNGRAGCAWVDLQQLLDRMLKPFEDKLVEVVDAAASRRVLDIGCGTGSTTIAVATRLGAKGHCVGVDISEPMIAIARTRAEGQDVPASFVCTDAQIYPFEPAKFDMIMSRFGVMFFDDPVQAFSNLLRAASDHAELRIIAWRSAAENPFMTAAERAAAALLPDIPPRQPAAPGQFAFADRHHVSSILRKSGWAEIDIQPTETECSLPEADLVKYFTRLGPVGSILAEVDEHTRKQLIETIRTAFDPYVHGTEVRFTAACWMIGARAPAASAAPRKSRGHV